MVPKQQTITKGAGTTSISLADYIINVLAGHSITHVFGYPGASIVPLMAAIERHPSVSWVLMRNEAAASLAASAHAKLTGRLAVCMATSGPGATNLITGLLDAQTDSQSVLAITGMVQTWRQGRFEFQDIDSAKVLGDLLPYSVQCTHPDQLPAMLRDCIGRAEQEHCVVHLAIAYDIQSFQPSPDDKRFSMADLPEPLFVHLPSGQDLDQVSRLLASSRQVVVTVGPGARGCGSKIEALAQKLKAPIITALNAKGIIDESHPCSLGVLGIFGAPGVEMAQKVIGGADTILAFGLRDLGGFVAGQDGIQVRRLIQCEPDFDSVTHRFHRDKTLIGSLDRIADELSGRISQRQDEQLLTESVALRRQFEATWAQLPQPSAAGDYVHPVSFLHELDHFLDSNTILGLDIGDNAVWSAQFSRLCQRQRIMVSENLGVMGFCLPSLIAAKLAEPNARVVGIAGDGGVQMTIGELGTAVQLGLTFVLIIFNNGVLGRIVAQQAHIFGSKIQNPDFPELARAYGADGVTVSRQEEIKPALTRAFEHNGSPFIIDVRCDPKVLAPMSKWEDGFTPLHFS